MASLRRGDCGGAPWEIVDPRDLKYCSNRCNCFSAAVDDPFAWRDRLPLARWGLAELQLMGWPLAVAAVSLFWSCWYLAWVPLALLGFLLYFFRDPPRRIPPDPGLLLSPADGRITEITRLDHDEHVGGPAVRIGIFLSLFDVHVNRSPCESRVVALRYSPGEFLNAINPRSARRNESMWIALEEESPPYRRMVVLQIAGAYARRIVCTLKTGESIGRGQKIGMIKLGSRTELIVPDEPQLRIEANVGDRVRGGASIIARY